MANYSSFYRIDNPEILAQIDAFFEHVHKFEDKAKVLCETYGVENYTAYNSILGGLGFCHLIAKQDQAIDETKWRVLKHKDPKFKIIKPRRTNKAFCAEFDALVPEQVSYRPLIKLLVAQEYHSWMPGVGYKHRLGQPFYFSTAAPPCDAAIEVVASEYRDAYKDQEAHA